MLKFKSAIVFMVIFVSNTLCDDYSITPITTSSGLYYEKIGEVLLSNNNWEFVTSIDYKAYLLFYEYLLQQAEQLEEFCETTNSSSCKQQIETLKLNMKTVAEVDTTMAHFLGIEAKRRRVKRFWAQAAAIAAPYILKPLGEALTNKIFGKMNQQDLQVYENNIKELYNSQQELRYNLEQQRTMFIVDSNRKNFQIEWLTKTQDNLVTSIKYLDEKVTKNAEERRMEMENLKAMLKDTENKIKMQEEVQNKLVGDVNSIKEKLKAIDIDVKDIRNIVDKHSNAIDALKIDVKINSIFQNFNFLFSRFESEQKTLLGVIKNANSGDLDPYIMTPINLIEMMQKAQSMLPENTRFPFYPNLENARKLYTLIKPTVYLYNNQIFFILAIPIVNGKIFGLHKMTSLPAPAKENIFAFIIPREPYLMVDKKDEEFAMLSSEDFRSCEKVNKSLYLCEQIHHLSSSHLNSECEMALFLNSKTIPDSCNKKIMSLNKPVFIQLQEPMSWIYVSPISENLIVSCGNLRRTVHFIGSGFIKINGSCSARTSQVNLNTLNRFSSSTLSRFSPNVSIIDSIDLSDIGSVEVKNYKEIILPFDFKGLEAMSIDNSRIVKSASLSTIHWIVLVMFALILLVTVALYRHKILKRL